jgi:hypothetical protein
MRNCLAIRFRFSMRCYPSLLTSLLFVTACSSAGGEDSNSSAVEPDSTDAADSSSDVEDNSNNVDGSDVDSSDVNSTEEGGETSTASSDPGEGPSSLPVEETDPNETTEATEPSVEPEPANPTAQHFGRFDIKVTPPIAETETSSAVAGSATLGGKVQSAAAPELVAWTPTLEQAGCKLLEPAIPQCNPPCAASDACSAGDVCVAQAESQSAGTITVRGLTTVSGNAEFTMDPLNATTNSYSAFGDSKLSYPPFEPGTEVQLIASGGAGQPFVLSAPGIAPLELLTEGPVPFAEDMPLVLDWVPSPESNARIQINVDISHHGGTKGEIVCDLLDSGHTEVPAGLVTRLIQLGVAGYPTVNVARKTVGSADPSVGDVELVIASIGERFLEIPGLISCNGGGCPEGQVCGQDLRCQ